MSYHVLARKWRPAFFNQLVGQSHVLKALTNALQQQRLHHAYLFSGTRGVGKTTIARLFAKSLNCEQGVVPEPCGQCSSCLDISQGRFVDLIEVDAASRTKVEDTRELLDNVQYAPTQGRFKIYLIDEVHMLSVSSFNALLKTLEEPPEHVKFLLATTDPQKLPVTVLSRCLQFNLKSMTQRQIVQRLDYILKQESIEFEVSALWAIAKSAHGSMRDALSLTDQAIAFGQGQLQARDVTVMLGTVDFEYVFELVQALLAKQAPLMLNLIESLDEYAPNYQTILTEVQSLLHRIAIAQAVPDAVGNHLGDRERVLQLAQQAHPEDVHLFYQIGGKAALEMEFAPSERAGFEMALLKMIAFSLTPSSEPFTPLTALALPSEKVDDLSDNIHSTAVPDVAVEHSMASEQSHNEVFEQTTHAHSQSMNVAYAQSAIAVAEETASKSEHKNVQTSSVRTDKTESIVDAQADSQTTFVEHPSIETQIDTQTPVAVQPSENVEIKPAWPNVSFEADPLFWWQITVHRLPLTGMAKTVFLNSQWQSFEQGILSLAVAPNYQKICNQDHHQQLLTALETWLEKCCELSVNFVKVERTPAIWLEQQIQQANKEAFEHLQRDNLVQHLIKKYAGELAQSSSVPNQYPIPIGV